MLAPYRTWSRQVTNELDQDAKNVLFLTSGGGVLYPPGSLHPMVLDEAMFMRLCPYADDIWLFWMTRRAGTAVRRVGATGKLLTWIGSQEVGLARENLLRGRNDVQIRAMEAELGPA